MALTYAMHQHKRSDSQEDEAYGGDMNEAESMVSGSITSFVRKLFQMVQAENDNVVGFVADGTAFEVKDPRRLEQDILPKYFRHSRFQSLVRQLNFYSFKKISKERSVWIYKHAFFRRDEPQLLHALKRKTNQQGGGRLFGGAMMLDSEPDDITLERIRQASYSKCRESHINKPRLRTESIHHHDHHHALQHHPSSSSHSNDTNPSRQPRQMTHGLDSSSRSNGARLYHASNSRSAGGGPSTGGIGGSAAPCYDSRGLSPRASGYDWAGAGGHPVTAGGDGLAHGSAHRNHGLRGGSLSPRDMATYTYQDDTVADDRMNSPRRRSSPEGARSSDRDDALALWGLSALCQVACAAEGTSLSDDSRGRSDGFSRGPPSKAQRSFEDGEGNQPKRARREDFRLGWGTAGDGNGRDNETSDEGEEDCITSAEQDGSAASYQSPSASHCNSASSDSDSSTRGSPRQRPIASAVKYSNRSCDNGGDDYEEDERDANSEYHHPKRSSGGVFCSRWDWGRAVNEPAMRLRGSFEDRRLKELDQMSCADGHSVEMDGEEDDEESIRTEAEDVDDDEEEAIANEASGDAKASVKSYAAVKETRVAITPRPRDLNADKEAEVAVGLKGIGELFAQLCAKANSGTSSDSVYLATVTNSGDSGLREIAVFCAGPAGKAPDIAPPASLARQVSSFLQAEEAIAQDLRVYAEALDPAAVDVVGRTTRQAAAAADPRSSGARDDSKLLRVFCRYAACRLGRAHEVTSVAAAAVDDVQTDDSLEQQSQREVAERVTPMLDDCRWKWWRAAVRFS